MYVTGLLLVNDLLGESFNRKLRLLMFICLNSGTSWIFFYGGLEEFKRVIFSSFLFLHTGTYQ